MFFLQNNNEWQLDEAVCPNASSTAMMRSKHEQSKSRFGLKRGGKWTELSLSRDDIVAQYSTWAERRRGNTQIEMGGQPISFCLA